jgi:lipid-A-disaccharide synthase
MLVAGEASGDAHGAGLVWALRAAGCDVRLYGVGGGAMAAAGVELRQGSQDLAVVGLTEVLGRLPRVIRLLRRLVAEIRRDPPDLFVPIDAPEFNLRLACAAAKRGVPVVYFVAPQVWAWRERRVQVLKRCVRELLVLFPFEPEWFAARGVPTTFVGHPLIDDLEAFRPDADLPRRLGLADGDTLGVMLPGSREGEIARHLPIFGVAARRLRSRFPRLRWVVRQAPEVDAGAYEPWTRDGTLALRQESVIELASAARIVVSASGTASFEAALTTTPLIVVYRVSPITWALARRMVRVPWVSMANLTAGRAIVPELLQRDLTPDRLAGEILALLEDPARAEGMRAELAAVRRRFDTRGAYARAAERVRAHLAGAAEAAR